MKYLPAILHAAALIIALCVQTMTTPLAGAWLFFYTCACCIMYTPPKEKDLLWCTALAWLFAVGLSAFILAPVPNGAATMWILAALPMLALSMREENLHSYCVATLIVLTGYALLLIGEMLLHTQYTFYSVAIRSQDRLAASWPLLDPNNAGCIMNFGLIPCFYLGLRNPKWFALVGIFAFALFATASRTACFCGALSCLILVFEFCPVAMAILPVAGFILLIDFPHSIFHDPSLLIRFAIWKISAQLLTIHPLTGLGLGTFWGYYNQLRIESDTYGSYAHNDVLQVAVECGIPIAVVFSVLIVSYLAMTRRCNIASGCVIISVFLHSLMEFQFYLPSLSILAGTAFAYHRINRPRSGESGDDA